MLEKIKNLLVRQRKAESIPELQFCERRAQWIQRKMTADPQDFRADAEVIPRLVKAAEQHGADTGEPDHTIGDLQAMLQDAWEIMSAPQRAVWRFSPAVLDTLEPGVVKDDCLVCGAPAIQEVAYGLCPECATKASKDDEGGYYDGQRH